MTMKMALMALVLLALAGCQNDVEATYSFPDVSTGFLIAKDRVSVPVAFELWDVKRITGDALVAEDLLAVGLSYRVTSLYEIKLGAWYGWDFANEDWLVGGHVLILKF
jgi:hypothetical protein